jgi:hypothetical protein
MGATQNLHLLKSLMLQPYQLLTPKRASPDFTSFSHHFGAYLRQSRKSKGQVVVRRINARRRGTDRAFGGERVPLHANELRNPTTEQLDALSKFFHEQQRAVR